MLGKAIITTSSRTVNSFGLLLNRLTPTRGAKKLSINLANLSSRGRVMLTVGEYALYAQDGAQLSPLPSSTPYARCFNKAGVQILEIPPHTQAGNIKHILDILSDRGVEKTRELLEKQNIRLEEGKINDLAQGTSNPVLLSKLANSHDSKIQILVAENNPHLSEDNLFEMIKYYFFDKELMAAVRKSPIIINLLDRAKTSNSPEELAFLAQKPFLWIKIAAVKNPNTPADVVADFLSILSKDASIHIWEEPVDLLPLPREILDIVHAVNKETSDIIDALIDSTRPPHLMASNVATAVFYQRKLFYEKQSASIWDQYADKVLAKVEDLNPDLYNLYDLILGHRLKRDLHPCAFPIYVGKNLELAKEILGIHALNRKEILNKLAGLNPDLYKAITDYEGYIDMWKS